jgi:NADH:ubiquinone oxidoreductase subunit E
MTTGTEISICLGSSCFSRGNKETLELIKSFLKAHELDHQVFFHGDLCTGDCEHGPVMKIDDQLFENVTPDNVFDILTSYFNPDETD